jgi:hypothetical protein
MSAAIQFFLPAVWDVDRSQPDSREERYLAFECLGHVFHRGAAELSARSLAAVGGEDLASHE